MSGIVRLPTPYVKDTAGVLPVRRTTRSCSMQKLDDGARAAPGEPQAQLEGDILRWLETRSGSDSPGGAEDGGPGRERDDRPAER